MNSSQKLQCLLLAVIGLSVCINAFKQELWISLDDGAALYFDKANADLTPYTSLLTGTRNMCFRGLWYAYTEKDYGMYYGVLGGDYDGTKDDIVCAQHYTGGWQSVRHQGTTETSVESLSLYTGPVWMDEQYVFTAAGPTGISQPIQSISVTGRSSWTLFEGANLDGRSMCYEGAPEGKNFHSGSGFGPLTIVGSVMKGCKVQHIERAKSVPKSLQQ